MPNYSVFSKEKWKPDQRPGYLGRHRVEKIEEYDTRFGPEKWEFGWKVGGVFVPFDGACSLYEDAYFNFFEKNTDITNLLINQALDVYDFDESNVNSGLNYGAQEDPRIHLQDVAIRRSLIRMGLWFEGEKLIKIRQEEGSHPLSMTLSPGRVPFHLPELIEKPELEKWWYPGTVESFYQSNRYVMARINPI